PYVWLHDLMSIVFYATVARAVQIDILSLHDALSDLGGSHRSGRSRDRGGVCNALPKSLSKDHAPCERGAAVKHGAARFVERSSQDRKSTRLNSSHGSISYAVFCLNKKTNTRSPPRTF